MKRQIQFIAALALAPALSSCSSLGFDLGGSSRGYLWSAEPPAAAAETEAEATPAAGPADLDGAIVQAHTQRLNGDYDGATRTLSQLVLVAPDNPYVMSEYGKTLVAKGEANDALDFLKRAIELQPGDWSLYSAQGIAYAQTGQYEGAKIAFSRALIFNPGEPTVLNNFALAHLHVGNLDDAEALLLQASASGAELPNLEQNLAMVQRLKAERALNNAVPLAPEAPAAVATALPAVPATGPVEVAAIAPPLETAPSEPVQAELAQAEPVPAATPQIATPAAAAPAIAPAAQAAPQPLVRSMAPIPDRIDNTEPASAARTAGPAQAAITGETASGSGPFQIQVGAYSSAENAERAAARASSIGAPVTIVTTQGSGLRRVRVGPIDGAQQANATLHQLASLGFADAQLLGDEPASGPAPQAASSGASLPSFRVSGNLRGSTE